MVQQVVDHDQIMIEVNEEQAKNLEKFLPELHHKMTNLGDTKIIVNEDMDKFKIKVRTEKGSVESSPQITGDRLKKEWNL